MTFCFNLRTGKRLWKWPKIISQKNYIIIYLFVFFGFWGVWHQKKTIFPKKMQRGFQKTLFWAKNYLKKKLTICFFSFVFFPSLTLLWDWCPFFSTFSSFSTLFLHFFFHFFPFLSLCLSLYISLYISRLPLFRSLSICVCVSHSLPLSLSLVFLYLSLTFFCISLSLSLFSVLSPLYFFSLSLSLLFLSLCIYIYTCMCIFLSVNQTFTHMLAIYVCVFPRLSLCLPLSTVFPQGLSVSLFLSLSLFSIFLPVETLPSLTPSLSLYTMHAFTKNLLTLWAHQRYGP